MRMKRMLPALLCLLLLTGAAAPAARAAGSFEIDPDHRAPGMARSWAQGYAPQLNGDNLSLVLPLRSADAKGAITARFVVEQELGSPFINNQTMARATGQNGLFLLRFTLPLHKDRRMGQYACRVEVEGQDAAGKVLSASFPLTILLDKGLPQPDALPLRISRLAAEGMQPGKKGMLTLSLENTSQAQLLRGLSLSVSEATGQILPAGSDTLYQESLAPGQGWQVELPLLVQASAAARPHQLQLVARYLDMEGKPRELSLRHTLTITHQAALHHSAPSFPGQVVQQSVHDYSLTLMNMGDGDLKHVLLTFDIPGFAQGQSVLVGEIPRDESRTAKAALTAGADTLGQVSGTVTVRYEDAYGVEGSFTLPFETLVEQQAPPASPPELSPRETPQPGLLTLLPWGLAGLLGLALLVHIILSKRRIRRLEEERL